ncbi:MAG: SpaH/EbpB family LPXTG-anchored major pilin [Acutalibacteraceae bacterium]|nr:SpaH/EbpB family LPXTG-anchored major pilin [Acutalibacteraceae bacterium]
MKKLFTFLLSMVLIFSMGTVAFAAGSGTITIENAEDGAEYKIYKMLDFAPSSADSSKGIYTIEENWEDFFTTAPATDFFNVVTSGGQVTVVLKKGVTEVNQTLAQAAIAYAKKNSDIAPAAKITADAAKAGETTTIKFENLELGYYAIDTSLGILCALTNTNTDFTAAEKNEKPDINKYVQEDRDNSWGEVNDADIDQVVNFKSTVTVGDGPTNYVMHDKMDKGLTFNNDVVVKLDADNSVVSKSNYTVTVSPADGDTFDVAFNDAFIADQKGTTFTVYYSATLNEDANIVTDGNDNTVYLSYGEDNKWETKEDTTTTYTWKFDVFKFAKEGENKISLAGAVFKLVDENGDDVKFTAVSTNTYKVDKDGTVDKIETETDGKFEIVGLDEGTYMLHEEKAPEGYNKLANPVAVEIKSEHSDDTLTASYKIEGLEDGKTTIEVENKTGGLFPNTGGIGTTIFYVVGSLLMVGSAVIFVTKKRMSTFS